MVFRGRIRFQILLSPFSKERTSTVTHVASFGNSKLKISIILMIFSKLPPTEKSPARQSYPYSVSVPLFMQGHYIPFSWERSPTSFFSNPQIGGIHYDPWFFVNSHQPPIIPGSLSIMWTKSGSRTSSLLLSFSGNVKTCPSLNQHSLTTSSQLIRPHLSFLAWVSFLTWISFLTYAFSIIVSLSFHNFILEVLYVQSIPSSFSFFPHTFVRD